MTAGREERREQLQRSEENGRVKKNQQRRRERGRSEGSGRGSEGARRNERHARKPEGVEIRRVSILPVDEEADLRECKTSESARY